MTLFSTPDPISLSVDVLAGSTHLIASDRNDTSVAVNPSDPRTAIDVEMARAIQVDLTDHRLSIVSPRAKRLKNYVSFSNTASVDVTVELPRGSSVDIQSGYGDVRADGLLGDVVVKLGAGGIYIDAARAARLSSGAGNLTINRGHGDLGVSTAGEIAIGPVDGNVDVKNSTGRTIVGDVAGGLRVRSSNGDVEAGRVASDVAVRTASGSIRLGSLVSGEVSLTTAMGAIDIGIARGTSAWLDARTKFGRVANSLESASDANRADTQVEIQARTSFGDIAIHRSPEH